jgi:hypothetical protein
MGTQFHKYRFKSTPLSDAEFNLRFRDVDARLVEIEDTIENFNTATDELITRGLQTINNQLQSQITELHDDVADAQSAIATTTSSLNTLQTAVNAIVIGGTLPAESITVTPSGALTATNAQDALVQLLTFHNALQTQVNAIDTNISISDVSGLQTALDGKASASHTHTISNVTGLQSALDGKQAASANLTAWAAVSTSAKQNALGYTPADKNGDDFTGQVRVIRDTATTAIDYIVVRPSDYGTGKPQLSLAKNATASVWELKLYDGVNNAGTISVLAGAFNISGTAQASSFNATSDRKLKRDIKRIKLQDADRILDLEAVTFRWKADGRYGRVETGFVAQQVAEHVPAAVNTDHDGRLSINLMPLLTLAIVKIQDQERQLKAQDSLINGLEKRLAALEARASGSRA